MVGACVVGARRAPGPFQSPPGGPIVESARSIGWIGGSIRPAPRAAFRPPLAHGSLRSPFAIEALPAVAPRFARDRPFRACGRSPHRERPFRAKMNLVSTPALHPFGSCGPRLRRPRRTWLRRGERGMRWPLAPGGSARGAGWFPHDSALSLAPCRALAKARARARSRHCRSLSSENRDGRSIAVSTRERLRSW